MRQACLTPVAHLLPGTADHPPSPCLWVVSTQQVCLLHHLVTSWLPQVTLRLVGEEAAVEMPLSRTPTQGSCRSWRPSAFGADRSLCVPFW